MNAAEYLQHWKSVCQGYGVIETEIDQGDTYDKIHVKAWGVKLLVYRPPGMTDVNYEALAIAGYHAGLGLSAGIEQGKEQMRAEIRAALGIK